MSRIQNDFHSLRDQRLAEATREFNARGKSVVRCERCLLARHACICAWRPRLQTRAEFVLLMHRNEVFKPTNTGRLIGDIFPAHTHVFCWHRTEPSPELLTLLNDPARQCYILYPADDTPEKPRTRVSELPSTGKTPTFIVLDGTWKQSSRMFHLSRWLDDFPCILLPEGNLRGYAVRKSHQDNYLSTAEAAALCLQMAGDNAQSQALLQYFQLFNQHYLATRGNYAPEIGDLHQQLSELSPSV